MASTRDVSDIIQRCIKILTDKGFTTSITTENLTEQKRLTIDIVKTDTNEPAATITACASTCEIQERHHTHDTRSPKLNMEINSINVNWVNSLIPKQQLGQLSIILAVLILYSNTNHVIVTLDNDSDLSGQIDIIMKKFKDIYSRYFNFKYKFLDSVVYSKNIPQEAIDSYIPDNRPSSDFITFSPPSTQPSTQSSDTNYTESQSQCSSCSSDSDYSTASEDMIEVKLGGPDMHTDIYDFIDKCIIILDDIQEKAAEQKEDKKRKGDSKAVAAVATTRTLRSAASKKVKKEEEEGKGIFSNKSKKRIRRRRRSNKLSNKPNNKTKKKRRKKRV